MVENVLDLSFLIVFKSSEFVVVDPEVFVHALGLLSEARFWHV